MRTTWVTGGLLWVLLLPGCASDPVIPEPLEGQVDRTVTFEQLRESPESHQGKMLVLGGEVLTAKRLKEGTQLEILQLPLDDNQPVFERDGSQGRFLALQREFLDPATVTGTRVTIVGEVTGAVTQRLDESEYRYPALDVKHLRVWENRPMAERRAGPGWGVFGGVGIGGGGSRGGVGVGVGF